MHSGPTALQDSTNGPAEPKAAKPVKTRALEHYLTERLTTLSRAASLAVACGGALVFLGWALDIPTLVRLIPAPVVMTPVTSLMFVLAGIALWLRVTEPPTPGVGRKRATAGLATIILIVGTLKILHHVTQWSFDIDQLLFPVQIAARDRYPLSEMAPSTAVNFVFCGLSLLFFHTRIHKGLCPGQGFALAVGGIAMLALIGYSYRVLLLYRFGAELPMSLESALEFLLFFIGYLAARPKHGIMAVLTSETTGGAMARRLLPTSVVVPWLLGGILLIIEQQGEFSIEFALSVFAAATLFIFGTVIWWNARLLHHLDLERANAEKQLRETTANLERSNTDLQQFAYVASHDLFEPLRMITSYLQLLGQKYQGQLDAQAQAFIGYALDGARRMDALIRDLLAYSRVDMRGRPLEPTDSEQILGAAIANLKVAIEESGATITHSRLPKVQADGIQLTQVFQNLLGNALKFRGSKTPHLEVNAHRRDHHWLFLVRDNGIGIEARDFERIFVIFQRLHTRQEYAGTGIGLAICKKIIERHGGRIWVESTPGEGSTFFFTLPAAANGGSAPQP